LKICAFISLSGGQGKTTAAFFTALLLAQQGKRVLAVDADPQANLTFYLGREVEENEPSLMEVLTGVVTTEDGIYATADPNLFIIPADRSLFKVSDFLASSGTGAFILKLRLKAVADLFDYVIVDVQPSRSQICLTALGAADLALIPVEANTKGVNSLIDTVKFINEQTNLAAFTGSISGIIPFRDRWVGNTQTVDSRENIAAMAELFPDLTIFPSIKESEQFKKGIRQCKTLTELGHGELEYPFTRIMEILTDD
jgi:chromosome partitioning protein